MESVNVLVTDICGWVIQVVGNGRQVDIDIVKTEKKGWGVFARNKILKGSYVGIYAGELITTDEADDRGQYVF